MKVWITGAGGMMGSHLAEMLLAAGHDVYATYCRPTIDPSDLQFNGAEVDITDWCSVYDSIATFRPDAVFHLAARPPLYMVGAPSGTKCHPGGKS